MLTIAFRVDASSTIGNGHLMRCLTLAHQLSNPTNKIYFICRAFSEEMLTHITFFGYSVLILPIGSVSVVKEKTATWLSDSQENDASKTIEVIKKLAFIDLMIVDSYAIDFTWHNLVQPYYNSLMVIDDLANRQHLCDILLDQTYHCEQVSYLPLVPKKCKFLLGEEFILLRGEFRKLRLETIKKRKSPPPSSIKLLITMGGTDPDNLNGIALNAVHKLKIKYPKLSVIIVLSANAPHLLTIQKLIASFSWISLKIDVNNIAELMKDAHLAIGESGSTSWERCCLGLPTLTIISADNQKKMDTVLACLGATKSLGLHTTLTDNDIVLAADSILSTPKIYNNMVKKSLLVCDGKGAIKASKRLDSIVPQIEYRIAKMEDCELTYRWQSNAQLRKYFIQPKTPSWQEHVQWYNACLLDPNRILYLLHDNQKNSVGLLRLDQLTENGHVTDEYEISIIISPEHQGKGIASRALKKLRLLRRNACYIATINNKNTHSINAFLKAGFQKSIQPALYSLNVIDFEIKNTNKT